MKTYRVKCSFEILDGKLEISLRNIGGKAIMEMAQFEPNTEKPVWVIELNHTEANKLYASVEEIVKQMREEGR